MATERPSLSQMRQRIRDGEIQGVVVTTIDRLSRDQVHLTIFMEEMDQHNVKLYGASEELDQTSQWCFARMTIALMGHIRLEKAE